ncbi:MAG: HAMP domain-containing sensor histidine kinase [Ktedonobacteraceae bacterium]
MAATKHFHQVRTLIAHMPLRWRVALASFGLLTLLLGTLGVLVSSLAENALLSNEVVALRDEAQLALTGGGKGHNLRLVSPSETPPTVGTPLPDLTMRATDLVHRLAGASVRATVFSPQDVVLASSNALPQVPASIAVNAAVIQQQLHMVQQEDTYKLLSDDQGQRQLVVFLPLVSNQHTVALLQLNTPTAPIDRSITTLRLILLFGILGALILAAALTLPLMSAALRPLVTMEQTSRRIAEGDLSLRLIVPPSQDEVGRLARAFNSMVARLEKTFQRQKQFVADVSHELRTPLTALGGSVEMLLLGADRGDRESSRRLMRSMYAEVERMRRLVEDLLVLTRLDEGRITMRIEQITVRPFFERICELVQPLAHGQIIQCDIAPDIAPMLADADRLQQVLLNLADNALKFTPASGSVKFKAWSENERVIIVVQDTGTGIPSEALLHVFDRFYRVDSARTRLPQHSGGSGLGLAIAKEMTEAQGGQITLTSEVGVGTTVTLRLRTPVTP